MRWRHILLIGLALYGLSFFIRAVGQLDGSGASPGYECAYFTLFFSLDQIRVWSHGVPSIDKPLEYVSFLVSGWINIVFLAALSLSFRERTRRTFAALRIILVLMVPFSWVVFVYEKLYPREGHFVWIIGMLLVLFSRELSKGDDRIRAMNSASDAPR